MLYNETLDIISSTDSCIVYIVFFVIFSITNICICCIFIYFHWYFKKNNMASGFNVGYLNVQMTTKQLNLKKYNRLLL